MQSRASISLLRLLTIIIPAIVLIGCLEGGSGPDSVAGAPRPPAVGLLVNSNVTGAEWETSGGESDFTDDGEYLYERGETVEFSVGDIILGVLGVTVDAADLLTPVELTGSTNPTDQAATNLYVFLQTIDENSPNSADGILITAATRAAFVGQSLNFASDSATFTADFQALLDAVLPGKTIVSEVDALDNFCQDTYLPGGGVFTFGYPFPGCVAGGNVELLSNGDFELPDATAGDIPCSFDWTCFNNVFTVETSNADGNFAPVSHGVPGAQSLKTFGEDGVAIQAVDAVPGATYEASAYAMNWIGDPLTNDNFGILILTFWDAPGGQFGTGTQIGPAIQVEAGIDNGSRIVLPVEDGADVSDWTQVDVSAVAPAGTQSAQLVLIHIDTNVTGGAIYWDDASLLGPGSSPPPPPPAQELLTNGDFELPDATAGDIPCSFDWTCFNNVFTVETSNADGNFAPVSHGVPGAQSLKTFGEDGVAIQAVDAVPGATYEASAYAMNWIGDPLTNDNFGILILTFWDAPGGQFGTGTQIGPAIQVEAGIDNGSRIVLPVEDGADVSDWTQVDVSAVAPAGTQSAQLVLIHIDTNVTGGAIYWDDASLLGPGSSPPPPPPAQELLTNGDFELPDATAGDIPCSFDWTCFNNVFTVETSNADGNFAPVSHGVPGAQSLKTFGEDGVAIQAVDAVPGATYEASAYAMNWIGDPLTNDNFGILILTFWDAPGGQFGTGTQIGPAIQVEAGIDNGSRIVLPVEDGADVSDWTQVDVSAVAPAGTQSAQLVLIHIDTNVTGGAIYWDDASLLGPSSGVPAGFQLVFSDEFNVDGPPDSIKWTAETGNGPPDNPVGFGNNEWQEYTTNPDNLRVEGGNLVIQARCEITPCVSETVSPGNGSITSAKIKTQNKFEFQYGIVRASIKASGGFAAWPAFWMLGFDFPVTPWPNAGEIDIMELFQNNSSPFETHSTIHFCDDRVSAPAACSFSNGYENTTTTPITASEFAIEKWSDDFHIYELEWTADRIIMRVDDIEVFNNVIDPAFMEEFQKDFYLIINLAMGGNLGPGGNQPPDPNRTFVETSLIDWVRVYQPVP